LKFQVGVSPRGRAVVNRTRKRFRPLRASLCRVPDYAEHLA
jgi:hypothetical protein